MAEFAIVRMHVLYSMYTVCIWSLFGLVVRKETPIHHISNYALCNILAWWKCCRISNSLNSRV